MTLIAHSGGAQGTDSYLSDIFSQHNYHVIHHSFKGHTCSNNTGEIIRHSQKELDKQIPILEKLLIHLDRDMPKKQYIKNLLLRTIFQVNNTELIMAVGEIINFRRGVVKSGTGYAVAYGILYKIPILFLDQIKLKWYCSLDGLPFQKLLRKPSISKFPKNITIVGSRELSIPAMKEISSRFSKRFVNV